MKLKTCPWFRLIETPLTRSILHYIQKCSDHWLLFSLRQQRLPTSAQCLQPPASKKLQRAWGLIPPELLLCARQWTPERAEKFLDPIQLASKSQRIRRGQHSSTSMLWMLWRTNLSWDRSSLYVLLFVVLFSFLFKTIYFFPFYFHYITQNTAPHSSPQTFHYINITKNRPFHRTQLAQSIRQKKKQPNVKLQWKQSQKIRNVKLI